MTTTPKRPSDAELVKLLRAFASELRESDRTNPLDFPECAKMHDECEAAADALEAAGAPPTCILTGAEGENPDDCTTHEHETSSADTFEARVATAASALEGADTHWRQSVLPPKTTATDYWRKMASTVLRAAGVEGE